MKLKEFAEYNRQTYNSLLLPKVRFLHYIYDFLFIYCTNNFPHKKTNRFIHNLCKRFKLKKKIILDIGSGLGYNSFYFHSERNKVTGIEISDSYMAYARKRYGSYNFDLIQGDVLEKLNQIEDNSVDFIFCIHLPAHYDSNLLSDSVFTELFFRSVLKKMNSDHGVFYYAFYCTISRFVHLPISEFDLKKLLIKLNIKHYEINTIGSAYPMLELIIRNNNDSTELN